MSKRCQGRAPDALRPVTITRNFTKNAPGSVLVCFGETKVLCTACFDPKAPAWMRGQERGWVTAEYAMLPGSTQTRVSRDSARQGRAQEISRLIGRSLRAVTDLKAMGECTVIVDCDVLQADGGTRSAAVTGAWVALHDAFSLSVRTGYLEEIPLTGQCAAVSAGVVGGEPMLDLCYAEDSEAAVDMNMVMDDAGRLIEIQGTAEGKPFERELLDRLLALGAKGTRELAAIQKASISNE